MTSTENQGLSSLDLPPVIETSEYRFSNDFYNPVLSNAIEYKRGVGFFSSSWFRYASRGLKGLANNGGLAKWIISPHLSEDDWAALEKGEEAKRDPKLYEELKELVADLEEGLEEETLNTIAWMIADGLLEIRIAVPEDNDSAIFHDKWGVVIGTEGGKIGFHGSQNDSQQGLNNYESFTIFPAWKSDEFAEIVEMHENRFDQIWEDRKPKWRTFSILDSIALEIANFRDSSNRPYDEPTEAQKLTSSYRWRHQEEAVEAFLDRGNGIMKMATGTGKTRTSLKVLDRLLMDDKVDNIVVATYGNDLLNQWYDKLVTTFEPEDIRLYREFGGHKELGSFLSRERDQLEVLIISYDGLAQCIESDTRGKLSNSFLICDEVHNLGSQARRESLDDELNVFPFRLGLSATPMDAYNETRNEFLIDEVGSIVYEFGLEEAIKRGILCELSYEPLFYELSEEDKEKQQEAFARYRALKADDPTVPKSRLYIMLARVRKESKEKLPKFRSLLEDDPQVLDDCLIFVETMDYGKLVQEIVHRFNKSYRTYYGVDQEENLAEFSDGEIKTLVTSRAIAEGIDIKSVKNIILFTSNRSRGTTIQRMGRALRVDPTNPDKEAKIVDFVVGSDIHKGEQEKLDEQDNRNDDEDLDPPDLDRYQWLTRLSKVEKEEDYESNGYRN